PQAESYSAWLPRASITYHYSEDISVFLSAQRGYRAGGTYVQSTILDGIPVTLQDSYDPEYLTNFELGLRTYYPDHALTINGSVFYSTLEDQQISLPGPTGNSLDVFTANVGETEIYGLEVSSSYAATDSLNIYATLGLLHAEFTEFPFATQVPDSQFFTLNGNEPELAPGITFSIGMSYKHASGAFADVNVSYIDGAETGVENLREEDLVNPEIPGSFVDLGIDPALAEGLDETADSRTNVNLRLGYEHENFKLALFGTNIFDDDTPLSQGFARVTAANGGLNFFSEPFFKVQQPRTLGIQVDFSL
ncbi:MAG: TonB-dependent receptor, partial [Halioglobus sp.]|nr:TonB-dependent receptor [Halioglobus sp.]